jgi:hypothetical protein
MVCRGERDLGGHVAHADTPDQRTAERTPFLTTRYCSIGADGQLTCAYSPRPPGFVYGRST